MVSLQHCKFKSAQFSFLSTTIQPLNRTGEALKETPVRILWASQTGTAQLFAQQLSEALEEREQEYEIKGWHESKDPTELLQPGNGIHLFLCSVAGVGEPPENGRKLYEWVMAQDDPSLLKGLEYAVFGLGNSKAHPKHYNVIGIALDEKLEELGASRICRLGLGDDGDCIEDDFDVWEADFLKTLNGPVFEAKSKESQEMDRKPRESDSSSLSTSPSPKSAQLISCLPGICKSEESNNQRLASTKYPPLNLKPPTSTVTCQDLFHLQGTGRQFYEDGTAKLGILGNKNITIDSAEAGLHEMRISLVHNQDERESDLSQKYETGDQLILYPQNSQCMVDAYLNALDVSPHTLIEEDQERSYPHPTGITLAETLTHCIDLGAIPSPAFSRFIVGRSELNYREEIAVPRRTVLDLMLHNNKRISLEDFLYNATRMKPRYYSISSSNLIHPNEVYLTYRPVKYVTSLGMLREGVCTSYMTNKGVTIDHPARGFAQVAAKVNVNPAFRLPKDPKTPILMIAGGCGVAPIRAFLEERIALDLPQDQYGRGSLYLGFRSPTDEVYQDLIAAAVEKGAIQDKKIAYSVWCPSNDCKNVSDLVAENGEAIWEHFETGGYTYLCGGARTFGAALEAVLVDIVAHHAKTDIEGADAYIRKLVQEGRLCEDLAD